MSFSELLSQNVTIKSEKYFYKYNITYDGIFEYFDLLSLKLGVFNVLKKLLDKEYYALMNSISIKEYCIQMNQEMIMNKIIEITNNNYNKVFDCFYKCIFRSDIMYLMAITIKKSIIENEKLDLEFNINNKELIENNEKVNFKSVSKLSLGQKVVAMFNFVLSYSEYCNDFTPLIVDQPEDNLDNQYIYKNLVKQLRDIKSKRQIIIATHNSTIVTNAKAEQVIVMESDGINGWVEATGYPNESRMLKRIVNHLEGGVESFNHKRFIYEEVLKE